LREEWLGRGAGEIVHDEFVPGLLQIGRHALAHHAEADKSDAHLSSPPNAKLLGGEFARPTHPSARMTNLCCARRVWLGPDYPPFSLRGHAPPAPSSCGRSGSAGRPCLPPALCAERGTARALVAA